MYGGGWEAEGGLHHPIGLFGVAMSPKSVSHRPRQDWRALRDVSPTQGRILDPYLPSIVSSMGPIVSVVASHGRQNPL